MAHYMRKPISVTASIFLLVVTLTCASVRPVSGMQWSVQLHQLTTNPEFDGFSSITQLADGTISVAWTREVLSNLKLFYKTSSDGGITWSSQTNLTDIYDEYEDKNPSITQSTNGTIWVTWATDRPPPPPPLEPDFSVEASPGNLTMPKNSSDTSTIIVTSLLGFSEEVDLMVLGQPSNVSTALNPDSVAPPPDGTANSTLTVTVGTEASAGNYTLFVIGRSAQKAHTTEIQLEITNSTALEGQAFGSSTVDSVLNEDSPGNSRIYYKVSHDSGATWSIHIPLENPSLSDNQDPSILQAMNGTIWIVWQTYRTGDYEIFYKVSSDGGASWTAPSNVTWNPASDKCPSITQSSDGRIWVAWCSYRTGQAEILYNTYNGTWSDPRRLTSDSNYVDTAPAIVETFNGTLFVFWSSAEDIVSANSDIFYRCSTDGGDNWAGSTLFTGNGADDLWPSTIQTRDTKTWVVWTANRTGNMELFYKTSLAGDRTGPGNPSGEPDGVVDHYDLALIRDAYGKQEGDPEWSEFGIADITGPENPPTSKRYPPDGTVDIHDLSVVGKSFGET